LSVFSVLSEREETAGLATGVYYYIDSAYKEYISSTQLVLVSANNIKSILSRDEHVSASSAAMHMASARTIDQL